MKFWMFLAFLVFVASFGWWLKAIEHMTEPNPIYGPKIVNKEKCEREYPAMYGANTYLIDGTIQQGLPTIPVDSTRQPTMAPVGSSSTNPQVPSATQPTSVKPRPGMEPQIQNRDTAPTLLERKSVSGPSSSWEQDDGIVSSDTATQNPLFSEVYTFNPYFQVSFPVSGPPQPFLTNFSKLHS